MCFQSLSHVQLFAPQGLQPARLLCPWNSPGKNTGVSCHFLLQGIFPTQGLNSSVLHCRKILYCLNHQGNSLGRFILGYFILFDVMVNGIVPFSFFYLSLLEFGSVSSSAGNRLISVYRIATDFCALILYPATLLNSLKTTPIVFW